MAARGGSAVALALAAFAGSTLGGGCAEAEPPVGRHERYGVFRDLVLFARRDDDGGAFFVDRFETSQGDWRAYLNATERDGEWELIADAQPFVDPQLPVVGVNLYQARDYARWRFGRVPREPDWSHAATAGGRYHFPWGDAESPAWANASELALGGLTPVGAFESGRQNNGPYDLIGNAGEWTESLHLRWPELSPPPTGRNESAVVAPRPLDLTLTRAWAGIASCPALDLWSPQALPLPAYWLYVGYGIDALPRLIVGNHVAPSWDAPTRDDGYWQNPALGVFAPQLDVLEPLAGSPRIGLRVVTDPDTLVEALLAERSLPRPAALALLREFLSRPDHRDALRTAVASRRDRLDDPTAPLGAVLRDEVRP